METLFSYMILGALLIFVYFFLSVVSSWKCKRQAVRDVRELTRNILAFYGKYRYYPIVDDKSDEQCCSIMNVLCGRKWAAGKWCTGRPISEDVAQLNPALINFSENLLGRRTINGHLVDPWGETYHIAIDTDNDGITEIFLSSSKEEICKRVNSPVAVWSNGPNRENDLGGGDDIASWIVT